MSRLFLVAGNSTESLGEYLRDKGSFEITGGVNSLVSEQRAISMKTVIADKLILHLQDTDLKFKQELMSLRKLVFGESFFLFSEMYIFIRSSDPDKESVEELLTIFIKDVDNRKDLNPISVNIIDTKEEYTFSDVYNMIIGESHIENMENQRIAKVRKPRDDDSRYAYAPMDSLDTVIKPYSYTNILRYEEIEKNALLAETGERLIEKARPMKKDGSTIPLVEVDDAGKKEVILIVGQDNSGKSLLGTSIAIAASMEQKKTCFIDLKEKSDLETIFERGMGTSIPYSSASLKEVYCYKTKYPDLHSFTILRGLESEENILLLADFLDGLQRLPYDLVVIEASQTFYTKYRTMLTSFLSLTILMCPAREQDVKEMKNLVAGESKVLIALTEFMPATLFNPSIGVKEIKNIVGLDKKLLSPLDLKTLRIPKSLYTIIRSVM